MDVAAIKPFAIGSEWRHGQVSSQTIVSVNPADGSVAGMVTRAAPSDVDRAVDIAWDAWKNKPVCSKEHLPFLYECAGHQNQGGQGGHAGRSRHPGWPSHFFCTS